MTRSSATRRSRSDELNEFVSTHYRRVVGAVTLITGDRAAAEDAVQDAIVKAWERHDQQLDRLAAWITVVASNGARDVGRRSTAERRAIERVGHRAETVSVDPLPLDAELVSAVTELPLRERQAAVLHYVHDLSVADVASAMDVADGTVKTLLSRARGHLAAALDSDGGADS